MNFLSCGNPLILCPTILIVRLSAQLHAPSQPGSLFSRVTLYYEKTLCGPWTVARQAPLCMKFSRQEYCSGLSRLSLGELPGPRDQTRISYASCTGRREAYHQRHLGSASLYSFLPPRRRRDSLRKKHLKCVQLSPVSCVGARLLLPVGEHSHGCDGNTLPTFMIPFPILLINTL